MRLAVMADAHANLPALEAALGAVGSLGCDAIYHIGDLISIGPYPAECLHLALATPGLRLTLGNHEIVYAHGIPNPRPDWLSDGEEAHERWVAEQIGPDLRGIVSEWPLCIEEDLFGLRISLLHYAFGEGPEGFAAGPRDPSAGDLDSLFADSRADLVFYGHTHRVSDIQGRARYVNVGALGCCSEALARFTVLDVQSDGHYQLREHAVPYDDAGLLREYERRQVPEREFLIRNLLWRR